MKIEYIAPTDSVLPATTGLLIRVSHADGSTIEINGDVEEFNLEIENEYMDVPDTWEDKYKRVETTGRQFVRLSATGAPEKRSGPVGSIRSSAGGLV